MEVIIKGDKWSKMELKGDKGQMFEPSKSFTDLVVWQRAHEFVLDVYKVTKTFPVEERFALCSQFQRAAISVPANIAEGYKNRGIDPKVAKSWVDSGWGLYGLPEEYGGKHWCNRGSGG